MEFKRNLKGFTLAEVMIVLTVIGVLTAILLPVARQSMPDENLMKFKKAHNTLGTVIRELVTSDKYYLDGDLGVKADGTILYEHPSFYFCHTLVDILDVKWSNCDVEYTGHPSAVDIATGTTLPGSSVARVAKEVTLDTINLSKEYVDSQCKDYYGGEHSEHMSEGGSSAGASVLFQTIDGVNWYEIGRVGFGWQNNTHEDATLYRRFSAPNQRPASYPDLHGMDRMYKIFCFDIDNPGEGEDPFGYGIRADGKILTGKRADEWLERDVNEE